MCLHVYPSFLDFLLIYPRSTSLGHLGAPSWLPVECISDPHNNSAYKQDRQFPSSVNDNPLEVFCCEIIEYRIYIECMYIYMASLVAQMVKNPPAVQETWVLSLGWGDPLEKEMATHTSILFFFNWKLITLQYRGGFCHTLT